MSVKEIYDFGNKISLNPMNKFSISASQSKNIDFLRQGISGILYLAKLWLLAVRKSCIDRTMGSLYEHVSMEIFRCLGCFTPYRLGH
jgi:hypothetical protein